jgi:predicted metal-dependent hydrolase
VIFGQLFRLKKAPKQKPHALQVGSRSVPVLMVHHPRARRYLLRLRSDGTVRVTIPRRGTISAAQEFAVRNSGWLEQQFQRLATQPKTPATWLVGSEILFRGEPVRIEADVDGSIRFGAERLKVDIASTDLRPVIQKHLRQLAAQALPKRVMELAGAHGIQVSRISVRNQKSRWGSCSRQGTISLNWRLVQTPIFVRDYIILHELVHRRQMNHSNKFWQAMELLCPDYMLAEKWLKQNANLLQ